MVTAIGASPAFAWATALAGAGDDADRVRWLVESTPDSLIARVFEAAGLEVEDLLPYA